ncbi:ribonuclease HII [Thermostaphylospora chromogena]|uniref:Ribonuclease HII n=1 Tax=Thermostaphylospora chromogena TaxID=35622 RepID=A0A1H1CCK5_9ACTN|nr:ribonuclease HII [Thermostaphylospora chromogena]SDQ61967.1 RNase HII [Thermostaphylospora chromogena]
MTETSNPAPGYALERLLLGSGASTGLVAGVDEVGRGAWAGPVTVCAVITDLSDPPPGLTDSKRLTPARRTALVPEILDWAVGVGYGEAEPAEIDELGMTEALRRAARRALEALPARPSAVILDGKHDYIGPPWPVRCQVKADLTSVSVAAASVLAKVRRDAFMAGLGYPEYGFADNAGYPSPVHQRALAEYGPTPHHRLSWSYLDDLPRWRHLKKHRDPQATEGQLTLLDL